MTRLTCKSVKESNGEIQINPGLLPLSHKGVCCIDCVDKIDQIQGSIIEVIERKKLSVAKKGGFDEFECDTTIVAAIEPRSNKLTSKKTLMENFLLDECLLNKFDQIILFVEEEKKKETKELKKDFGLLEKIGASQYFNVIPGSDQSDRVERLAKGIYEVSQNLERVMKVIQENEAGQCSRQPSNNRTIFR